MWVKAVISFGIVGLYEVMGRLTGIHFFLFGIFWLGFLFLFRVSYSDLRKRYGFRIVCFLYISLLFFTFLFCYYLRIYLFSKTGFLFSSVLTVFLGTFAFSGLGGEIIPHGDASSSSGWTAFDLDVLGSSMPETESRRGTPSTNGGSSEPSVNQTPAISSGQTERDSSVEPPVAEESLSSSHPPEDQLRVRELQRRLHTLIRDQYCHYIERGYPRWQQSDPEIYNEVATLLLDGLEIPPKVSELQDWLEHLRNDPKTLHSYFKEFKRV